MKPQLPAMPEAIRAVLRDTITEADVEASVATLRSALSAKTTVRKGGGAYHMVEDWRTRVVAAKLLIEFREGKAAQKVEHSGNVGHIHATPEQILATAGRRFGPTERIVREYLAGDDAHTVELPQPAAKEPVTIDVEL